MKNTVIEKPKTAKNTVSILLKGVPLWFHKRMKEHRQKIAFEQRKDFTLSETYVEYLKDAADKDKSV